MIVSSLFVLGASLVVLFILKWIRDRKYKQTLFKRLNYDGPEPALLFGNFAELMERGTKGCLIDWTKQYGKIFGYFEGEVPILAVSDPELVKQICIKEFPKFHSHKPMLMDEIDYPQQEMFTASGEKWRRLRNITSPSFASRRMKEMAPLINKSVTDFLNLCDELSKDGKTININAIAGRLTTDVISSCAFGVESNCLKDENSLFLVKTKELFELFESKFPLRLKFTMFFSTLFPDLLYFLKKNFKVFDRMVSASFCYEWHHSMAKQVILQRKEMMDQDKRVDFVRLMLEANQQLESGSLSTNEETSYNKELSDSTSTQSKKIQPMTIGEMQGQMRIILNAGYDTSSAALSFTFYELALHPDIQEKLQQEIYEQFPTGKTELDYNDVQKLVYMDLVMKEVLRIHPIVLLVNRYCNEDTTYKGRTIPKGMTILVNMLDLHFNPELWGKHDPQKFVPERFQEDCTNVGNTMAWIPFGAGPRMCIGMRFAILEYKIALARLLMKFTIKKCPETKVPCPTKVMALLTPSEGVHVQLEKRN